MPSFRARVRRSEGESPEAWRERAVAEALAEAENRGWVVSSVRLTGIRGGPIILEAAASLLEVVVEGGPHANPRLSPATPAPAST